MLFLQIGIILDEQPLAFYPGIRLFTSSGTAARLDEATLCLQGFISMYTLSWACPGSPRDYPGAKPLYVGRSFRSDMKYWRGCRVGNLLIL